MWKKQLLHEELQEELSRITKPQDNRCLDRGLNPFCEKVSRRSHSSICTVHISKIICKEKWDHPAGSQDAARFGPERVAAINHSDVTSAPLNIGYYAQFVSSPGCFYAVSTWALLQCIQQPTAWTDPTLLLAATPQHRDTRRHRNNTQVSEAKCSNPPANSTYWSSNPTEQSSVWGANSRPALQKISYLKFITALLDNIRKAGWLILSELLIFSVWTDGCNII
jgi:hypothetical protein